MKVLLDVTLPVFLIVGAGYLVVWRELLTSKDISGLMLFAQGFAIPCLLFRAISGLDLALGVDLKLLASFYSGSIACFVLGALGARHLFGRSSAHSVVIGFSAMFGNTVLIGLAIVGRAYGEASLASSYAIVALHAPFCYLIGITTMELLMNQGDGPLETAQRVLRAMFRNAIMVGIFLGFLFNLLDAPVPSVIGDALDMMARAALPAALFGLGGVLVRYRPEGDIKVIAWVCVVSLLFHPAIAWLMSVQLFETNLDLTRSAVVIAAMAPGINAYIFANMYGGAQRVAASTVLAGTIISIFTASGWIVVVG